VVSVVVVFVVVGVVVVLLEVVVVVDELAGGGGGGGAAADVEEDAADDEEDDDPLLPANCHQLKLNRDPDPLPPKTKNRSCVPEAPLTVHVTVCQFCQPPVPGTVQVPMSVPVVLLRRRAMVPPLLAEATRAEKDVAPVPKLTPLTLM
jgi:hypothetical protein